MMSEHDLINLFVSRNPQAISETQRVYGNYLYQIAFRVLGNQEDAEECVNDTLLSGWNSIPPTIPKNLKAFLSTTVRNISLDIYRKEHTQKREGILLELIDEISSSEEDSLENLFHEKEVAKCIDVFLEGMTKEKRFLFLGRYYYGYSVIDLVKIRGLSESKVKSTLFRMRKQLKNKLKKDGLLE